MFLEVIPFGGSIDDEGLTYFARDELAESIQIGCLVEVPFRNALDYAIVSKIGDLDVPESPKSIVRTVTSTPLLAPYQIHTIFACASYYFVHTHHILSLFLPKTFVKYLEKKDFGALNSLPSPSGGEIQGGVNKPIGFLHHTSKIPFVEIIQERIIDSTVLVFPDDFSIDAYLKNSDLKTESTLVVYDKLTDTAKIKAFASVYNGEKNIIIGTRRILYYNLSRYSRILYIEDALHKTAMRFNHTYKHLDILRMIAKESHLQIEILSSLPSVESMYLLHTGDYRVMNN